MPNSKSAVKTIRKVKYKTAVNRIRKSKYKSSVKIIEDLIENKKKKEALNLLPKVSSQMTKISKTGIISPKKASRKISKITKQIAQI